MRRKAGAIMAITGMQLFLWYATRIVVELEKWGQADVMNAEMQSRLTTAGMCVLLGCLLMIFGDVLYRKDCIKRNGEKQKNVMLRMEWKRRYPLKKFVVFLAWNFLLLAGGGTVILIFVEKDFSGWIGSLIFFMSPICTFPPMKKYVSPRYRCLPHAGDVLSKAELNEMLAEEQFRRVEDFKELSIYPYIKESGNWFWLNGLLLHKKMIIGMRIWVTSSSGRSDSLIYIMYIDGKVEKRSQLDIYFRMKTEIYSYLQKKAGICDERLNQILWSDKKLDAARECINNSEYGKMGFRERMEHVEEIRELLAEKFDDKKDKEKYQMDRSKDNKKKSGRKK